MKSLRAGFTGLVAVAALAVLSGCERPPVETAQTGYRGTGMEQVTNPRLVAREAALHVAPAALDPVSADGPKARDVYKNVQVLGDLSVGEFTRFMVAMTNWVSPDQGCLYCHTQNFAEETLYTKAVSRRMIQMTQKVNADWKNHVADTGVTCYTCHRGQPVPNDIWFAPQPQRQANRMLGDDAGQNKAGAAVNLSSLPYDPFGPYLASADSKPIRIITQTALPTGNAASIKQTEHTYGLMIHMSESLGVNCTFCHNTRSFTTWDGSPPQRANAWYGIRMVRELNAEYLTPLASTFPPNRLGPTGDVPKVNCGTCHQGVSKPLGGANMLQAHPELASYAKPAAPGTALPGTSAMPTPAAGATAAPGAVTVLFDVGSATLAPDAAAALGPVVESLKANPAASVSISGFHSATGDPAANETLARNRAMAVRDALAAAGIPESRLMLEKPAQTEANLSGEDPRSRRVDLTLK
jgi:photosynthetic reaction center cytochrome c subunit